MTTPNQPNLSKVISLAGSDFVDTQNMGITPVTSNRIENTVNYTENYPSSVASNPINLKYIATNINNVAVRPSILAWFNTVTGKNLNTLPNLEVIINTLVADNYVTLSGPPTTTGAVSAFQQQFNTTVQSFLTYLQQHPTNLSTPQDYTDAFYAFLNAQDVSGSDPTVQSFDFTFVSSDPSNPTTFSLSTTDVNTLISSNALPNQVAIPINTNNPAFLNMVIANFMAMLQHSSQDPSDPYGADLLNATSLSTSEQADLYNNSLGTFLQYVSTQTSGSSSQNFFQQWEEGAVAFAMMNYPTTAIPPGSIGSLANKSSYTLYKELWDTYFPNDPEEFVPTLLAFISGIKNAGQPFVPVGTGLSTPSGFPAPVVGITSGTLGQTTHVNYAVGTFDPGTGGAASGFTPSGALSQWGNLLRISAGGAPALQTTSDGGFDQIQLIFSIYNLLLDMLNSLQKLTATQLERQLFYGAYQSVYTKSESQIAAVLGAGDPPGVTGPNPIKGYNTGTDNDNITRRSDMSQLSSQFTESVKSFRSEINDLSGQQNTAVNQSQEAVSQQVNLAQTLIQQFGTILQSIWR